MTPLTFSADMAVSDVHASEAVVHLVSRGDEFTWDSAPSPIDLSDLECQPLLASDLPLNSEVRTT